MLPFLLALLAVASAENLQCGESATWDGVGDDDALIVGGTEAPKHAYPWQVSVERCTYLGCTHDCGGVLLSKTYVLTAAHCVAAPGITRYRFVVGMHKREDFARNDTRRIGAVRVKRHPFWRNIGRNGFPNDIAVVKLERPAPIDNVTVVPAKLPTHADQDFTSSECWISGWGRQEGGEPLAPTLQHARVDAISQEECRSHLGYVITDLYHLCIFDRANEATAACNGDSGGPLNCRTGNSTWTVAGVSSFGVQGCATYTPSVYTRVSNYLQFIRDNTKDEYVC